VAEFYCGEAMCKARVNLPSPPRFPVVCAACGAALLPEDELFKRPRSAREAKRAVLMRDGPDGRTPVRSTAQVASADDTDAQIDALLETVASTEHPQRFGSPAALFLAVVIVGVLIAGIVVFMLR
jgi:hypothetical protein